MSIIKRRSRGGALRPGIRSYDSATDAPGPGDCRRGSGTYVHAWGEQYLVRETLTDVSFVHVGKSGGTALGNYFLERGILLNEYHLKRPSLRQRELYILWIRHPLTRFVSAFNHVKSILDADLDRYRSEAPSLSNSVAPGRIQKRMMRGVAFSDEYDALVREFKSANHLAEAITSSTRSVRSSANKLMNHPQEHIFKGLGWYLHNGRLVRRHHDRVFFVGSVENSDRDLADLLDKLKLERVPGGKLKVVRKGNPAYPGALSSVAARNLQSFYADSDYQALRDLRDHGLISQQLFDDYSSYDASV